MSVLLPLDFDECSLEPNPCGDNADCTNNVGSYSCKCKQGFTGNGTDCEGMWKVLLMAMVISGNGNGITE